MNSRFANIAKKNHWPLRLQAHQCSFSLLQSVLRCIHKLFRINTLEWANKANGVSHLFLHSVCIVRGGTKIKNPFENYIRFVFRLQYTTDHTTWAILFNRI